MFLNGLKHWHVREHRLLVISCAAILVVVLIVLFVPGPPWTGIRAAAKNRIAMIFGGTALADGPATKMLNVPFYRQQHALSCEMASLRSALAAIGVNVSEAQLLKELPRDTTPKRATSRTSFTWGDPDKGFVGNVDGAMPSSGYGVHAPPVAQVAQKYAKASVISIDDPETLATAVDAGHIVEVWTVIGSNPSKITWSTPDGKTVDAALYEHVQVVAGYKRADDGTITNIYVVDPKTGARELTWKEFHWRTSFLDYQGVEIEPISF